MISDAVDWPVRQVISSATCRSQDVWRFSVSVPCEDGRCVETAAAFIRPLDGRSIPGASVGRGRGVLRATGGPVDLDYHPARGGPGFDQFERGVRAGVGEQPRALADDQRDGEQGDLVDKLVVE